MKNLRILCTGESWYGATGRACTSALRSLNCDVSEVSIDHYVPQWRRRSSRAVGRLIFPIARSEFNRAILHQASQHGPTMFLAFKGPYVEADTLQKMRDMGIKLYNYYPDTSAFTHGPILPKALPEYDCIFYTKPFWDKDARQRLPLRASSFLEHGYDAELHKPWPLSKKDIASYDVDVAVIGSQTRYKEDLLRQLLKLRPKLNLKIWGNRWETSKDEDILNCWQRGPLTGQAYSRALQVARINLAITSGIVKGASQGDDVTTRTFQIPASRGFMLHERNPEVCNLFEEGKEMACFGSVTELAEKIDYYLAHPEERTAIAAAGYHRCVPAYSYTTRMRSLLQWHREHFPEDSLSAGA
jgi:spore maturation protein CgeB